MKERVTKIGTRLFVTTAMVFMFALNWGNMKEVKAAVAELYWPVRNSAGNAVTGLSSGHSDGDGHKGIDIANSAGCGWYAAYGGTVYKVYKGCVSNGYNTGGHTGCSPNHGRYYLSGTIGGVNYAGNYCNNGFGNGVVIECNINGTLYYMQYAHMDTVASNLYEGQSISQGTYLGTVGDRGFSFGTHAHFEINQGSQWGTAINNQPGAAGCQFTYNYGGNDTTSPQISDYKVTNITTTSFTVEATVTDNVGVTMGEFIVWSDNNGQDDIYGYKGTISGNKITYTINISNHNNDKGYYYCDLYLYDAAGNKSSKRLSNIYIGDTERPTISDYKVTKITDTYFTVEATVTDNIGLKGGEFMVWSVNNDQDDLKGHKGTLSGNKITCTIKLSDHNNDTGQYYCDLYLYDTTGNVVSKRIKNIIVGDTEKPVISNYVLLEKTDTYFVVSATVTDNSQVTLGEFMVWSHNNEQDDLKGHYGTINGDTITCKVNISDHNNDTGLYSCHLYLYDASGNSSSKGLNNIFIGDCTHEWNEGEVIKESSCDETGETVYACTICKETKTETTVATGHTEVTDEAIAPTCTETGKTEGSHCSVCGEVLVEQEEISATGKHTEVVDEAIAPTCIETGKTEGSHCSVCGEVLAAQEEMPATGHTEVIDKTVAPTCAEKGKSEGSHCSVCQEVLVAQEEISATGHTEVIDKTVAPTCTEKGKSEGSHCSVCGEVLVAQEEIPATGHTEVTDEAVAPTCTEKGKSEGSHCSVCEAVIVEQKEIAATQHTWDEGKITKAPTVTAEGEKLYTCKNCSTTKTEKIAKLPSDNTDTKKPDNSNNPNTSDEQNKSDHQDKTDDSDTKQDENITDTNEEVSVGNVVSDSDAGTEYVVTNTDGDIPTVEFTGYTGTESNVVIPNVIKVNGVSYKVTSIADDAFKNNKTITNIIIGDNVTVIGKNAFSGCVNLKSVIIGKNVTTIGSKAFYNCKNLTKITIPSKVTKIDSYAFKNCKKLSSVTIGKAVKTIGKEAFRGCSKLKSINIKSKKLKTVGKNAFKGIKSSAKIKVPSAKLKSYKNLLKNKGQGKKVKITK